MGGVKTVLDARNHLLRRFVQRFLDHSPGPLGEALLHQVARTLGDPDYQYSVQRSRQHLRHQHPTPGRHGTDHRHGALIRGEQNDPVIEQERQKNADHNRQLLQRTKAAPLIGRRHLSDVGRSQHAGETNPQATNDAPDDQADQGLRQRRSNGADQKQTRSHHHAVASPDPVRQPSSGKGTNG